MMFYFAAKITIAVGAILCALWAPTSLWLAVTAGEPKEWGGAFLGGCILFVTLSCSIAGALAAMGWAFG